MSNEKINGASLKLDTHLFPAVTTVEHLFACHLQWISKLLFQQCHTPDRMWFSHFFLKVDMWPRQAENIFTPPLFFDFEVFVLLSCFFHSSSLALCNSVKRSLTVTHYMGKLTNVKAQTESVCLMFLLNRKDSCFVYRAILFTCSSYPLTCPSLYSLLLMVTTR